MTYHAPVLESFFFLEHCTSLKRLAGGNPDLSPDLVKSVLEEAGKFADGVLAPLNRVGDEQGTRFENGVVRTPTGWREAYKAWAAAGWNGLGAAPEYGGQALPTLVNVACLEFWSAACMAWGLGPILTISAIEALHAHASEELKKKYLARLVSGEWMGSMQLTEPQAGSDLATLRTRAARSPDGSYRLKGTKIFISYGEHDMTDNIIHLVLARLPDAPAGTKGISLFLVPKFLVKDDGSLGARNDVRASGVEHKLGIHASPTCTMVLGDNDGAVGYLVGEENRGLACMFTMMNQARLAVGIQGVGIAERALQQAFAFARERKQGAAPGGNGAAPIIEHPDVKRMLLTMRALTSASRAISYKCADAIDRAKHLPDKNERQAAQEEANMLTPVAKAFSTDAGIEVASIGVQVHGGMGFIEETGAAQHYRDARIAAIYEGTNGIQALDLVTRKITQEGGKTVAAYIGELRRTVKTVKESNAPAFGETSSRLGEAVDSLERATTWLLTQKSSEAALAGATPYLRMFANAAGGCMLAEDAIAKLRSGQDGAAQISLARFFAENVAVQSGGLERMVTEGAASLAAAHAALER